MFRQGRIQDCVQCRIVGAEELFITRLRNLDHPTDQPNLAVRGGGAQLSFEI